CCCRRRRRAEFVADLDQARAALESRSGFNLIHQRTYLKVDVFLCLTAFEREATRRAEPIAISGAREALRRERPSPPGRCREGCG
ncbi:MAG TPA: hypothetical protein VKA84_06230, partial [Gemmatimonadaceae bacterium]|nr:hypothetical protein [Gemmatimonadaceae bacterium]